MHNMAYLIGRLTNNVELEHEDDKDKARITLAVEREFKNEEGVYETDFIDVELYGEIATHTEKYCKKGDLVGIKGRIRNVNTEHGSTTVIVVDKITFLSSANELKKDDGVEC